MPRSGSCRVLVSLSVSVGRVDLWQVEAACRRAWPAEIEQSDGRSAWVFRRSGGSTRRTNSVNPVGPEAERTEVPLAAAEAFYALHGQPLIVRLPSFLERASERLVDLGFDRAARTSTLWMPFPPGKLDATASVQLSATAGSEWLAAKRGMTPSDAAQWRVYTAMVKRIDRPVCFASAHVEHEIGAVAYGVLDGDLVVIESVATQATLRRSGLAFAAVRSLLGWAQTRGATQACLQVLTDNLAARRLYHKLGFSRELYSYGYFQRASS